MNMFNLQWSYPRKADQADLDVKSQDTLQGLIEPSSEQVVVFSEPKLLGLDDGASSHQSMGIQQWQPGVPASCTNNLPGELCWAQFETEAEQLEDVASASINGTDLDVLEAGKG